MTDKRLVVLWCALRFFTVRKIKLNVQGHLKCYPVAFGESTMSRPHVQLWYNRFKEGLEDVIAHPDLASTSTTDEYIETVKTMILDNCRIIIRAVAVASVGISFGSCQVIFTDILDMKRAAAKIVLKFLNFEQNLDIAQEMLTTFKDDPDLFKEVITGNELWVYGYDIETKTQSSQCKHPEEPRLKKAHQVRSDVMVLLTGVVHHEFLPQDYAVNKEYYLEVMLRLRETIRQKRIELWKNQSWILHCDNAPAHTSMIVREFLAKNKSKIMDYIRKLTLFDRFSSIGA